MSLTNKPRFLLPSLSRYPLEKRTLVLQRLRSLPTIHLINRTNFGAVEDGLTVEEEVGGEVARTITKHPEHPFALAIRPRPVIGTLDLHFLQYFSFFTH